MKQDEKTQQTRKIIIDAAQKKFGSMGYDKASLNDICKKSCISKGLFYHNFPSKKELYLYCVEKTFESLVNYLDLPESKKDIYSYIKNRSIFLKKNPNDARIFFDTMLQPSMDIIDEIKEIQKPFNNLTKKVCRTFLSTVKLRSGISEKEALSYFELVQAMFNSYFGSPNYFANTLDEKISSHEKMLDKLIDNMLYGVVDGEAK